MYLHQETSFVDVSTSIFLKETAMENFSNFELLCLQSAPSDPETPKGPKQ